MSPPPGAAPPVEPAAEGSGGLRLQPGTLPRAMVVATVMLSVLALAAWFRFSGATLPPMDRYLRLGPAGAAAALERELATEFPAGSPVAPVIQRLQALGMRCGVTTEPGAPWLCAITVRAPEGRRSLQLQASIGVVGDRVMSVQTAASERLP